MATPRRATWIFRGRPEKNSDDERSVPAQVLTPCWIGLTLADFSHEGVVGDRAARPNRAINLWSISQRAPGSRSKLSRQVVSGWVAVFAVAVPWVSAALIAGVWVVPLTRRRRALTLRAARWLSYLSVADIMVVVLFVQSYEMHIFSSWVIQDNLGTAQCKSLAHAAGEDTCWVVEGAWRAPLLVMAASTALLEFMLGATLDLAQKSERTGAYALLAAAEDDAGLV